jgi:predicted nuclease of restriction endonuclease-like (RecB) superfamily
MGIKAPLERQFYAQMCCAEHWDTRTLDEKIDKQLYLQTALSRKPEEVIKKELEESKSKNQLCHILTEIWQLIINMVTEWGYVCTPVLVARY